MTPSSVADREVNTHLKSLLVEQSSLVVQRSQVSLLPSSIISRRAARRIERALKRTQDEIESIRQWQAERKEAS